MIGPASPPCAPRARSARTCTPDIRRPAMIHVSRAVILCLMLVALLAGVAGAWDRGHAERFATLPPGTAHPEGLAADHAGNIWSADFDVSKPSGPGDVTAFRPAT